MDKLYPYVFHYDPYCKKWNAIPREEYVKYWTQPDECKGVLRSNEISTLITMIERGEDFIKSIK